MPSTDKRSSGLVIVLGLSLSGWLSSCAYRWGLARYGLPDGVKQVYVPLCKNYSLEPGVEIYVTNGLVKEFHRLAASQVVSDPLSAQGEIRCFIQKIEISPGGRRQGGDLPPGVVLASDFLLSLTADVQLWSYRQSKVLWQSTLTRQINYPAAQVAQPVVNTVNATYDQSARHIYLERLGESLGAESARSMSAITTSGEKL